MDLLTATAGLGLGLGLVFHTLHKKDKTGREPWDPSKDTAEYDYIILGGKKRRKMGPAYSELLFLLKTGSLTHIFFSSQTGGCFFWLNQAAPQDVSWPPG